MKNSNYKILFLMLILAAALSSCKSGSQNNNKKVLTDRIQYDVFIKTPNPDYDWWVQNIEGRQREAFVKMFMDRVYSGEIKIYDNITNKPITVKQFNEQYNRVDSITLQRSTPPYAYYDTIVKKEFNPNQIVKLRFLEEWYIDEKTLQIDKKVVGISPIVENFSPNGEMRGYTPLFWIYLDSKYPIK